MRTALLVLTVSLFFIASAVGDNPEQECGIITGDDLQRAGIMRLSDIFLLLDDWDIASIDGVTWSVSALGLESYQHQRWIVALDSVVIDADLFDITALDRLPISIDQVASIEIISGPSLFVGHFADAGVISIHSLKPDEELKANIRGAIGNEIGDPGPYRYTEYGADNIDKTGHDASFGLAYGTGTAYLLGGIKRDVSYRTDKAILRRIYSVTLGDYPLQELIAGWIEFGIRRDNYRHNIFAGISEYDEFLFLKQYGREIPANSRLYNFHQSGTILRRENAALEYRMDYSRNKLNKNPNLYDIDFDWDRQSLDLIAEFSAKMSSNAEIILGAGLECNVVERSQYILNKRKTLGKTFINLSQALSKNYRQSLCLFAYYDDDNITLKGLYNARWILNADNCFDASVSFSESHRREYNDIWYWTEQGYWFLDANGIDYTIDGEIGPTKKFTADIEYSHRMTDAVSFKLKSYIRSFSDYYFEEQFFQYDSDDQSFAGPVALYTGIDGSIAGIKATLESRLTNRLKVNMSYRYQSSSNGDELFENAWNTIPEHSASGTVSCTPVDNLSVWLKIKYTSATFWNDYLNAEIESDGKYNPEINDIIRVDLAVRKYFWKRKLCADFIMRNLLNDELRYHPIGARFDLSYFVQVELMFDFPAGKN